MKFSVGDIILIKETGEEGRVAALINKKFVEVETGKKRFPIAVSAIDFPYFKWFSDQRKSRQEKGTEATFNNPGNGHPEHDRAGFYFSFLPVFRFDGFEDVADKLIVSFRNNTPAAVFLQYDCMSHDGNIYSAEVKLEAFEECLLHEIDLEAMNAQPRFTGVLITAAGKHQKRLEASVRIKPRKLFDYLSQYLQGKKAPLLLKFADSFPEIKRRMDVPDPLPAPKPAPKKSRGAKPIPEIDLHFEALAPGLKGLSNFEILTIQLNALEEALSQAIRAMQPSMVIIHGVGKGKLKEEVHAVLRSYPEINFFQQEWSPKYGHGATVVFFK